MDHFHVRHPFKPVLWRAFATHGVRPFPTRGMGEIEMGTRRCADLYAYLLFTAITMPMLLDFLMDVIFPVFWEFLSTRYAPLVLWCVFTVYRRGSFFF